MKNKVFKNSLLLFSSNLMGKLFYFFATIIMIRTAHYENYGLFIYGLSIAFIVSTLLDLGTDKIYIREASISKERLNDIFSLLSAKSIIFLLITLIFFLIPGTNKLPIYILLFSMYIKSLLNGYISAIEATQKMEKESIIIFFGNILFLVFIIIFSKNILMFSFSYLFSALLQLIFAIIISPVRGFKFGNLKRYFVLLKIGIPIGIIIIFSTIEFRLDTLLIKNLLNASKTGLYNSVYLFMTAFLLVPNAFSNSFFPHISKVRSNTKVVKITINYALLLSGIAFAFIFIFTPLSKFFIDLFYKTSSLEQVYTLKILLLSLFPIYFSAPFIFSFYSRNLQKIVLLIVTIKITANLLLNLHFIPLWGIKGAAWVMFVTESLGAALFFIVFLVKFKKNE